MPKRLVQWTDLLESSGWSFSCYALEEEEEEEALLQ